MLGGGSRSSHILARVSWKSGVFKCMHSHKISSSTRTGLRLRTAARINSQVHLRSNDLPVFTYPCIWENLFTGIRKHGFTSKVDQRRGLEPLRSDEILLTQLESIPSTVKAHHHLITKLTNEKRFDDAIRVFDSMYEKGIEPDLDTYKSLLSVYRSQYLGGKAVDILREMNKKGFSPDKATYNSVISACCKCGQWENALELYEEMLNLNVTPDLLTYNLALAACGMGKQWEKALGFFEGISNAGMRPDTSSFNTLMSLCEKTGNHEKTLELFETMKANENIELNPLSYSLAILALRKVKHMCPKMHSKQQELLQEIKDNRLYDQVQRNLIKQTLYHWIEDMSVQSSLEAHNKVLKKISKHKQFADIAMRVFRSIQDKGLKPNIVTLEMMARILVYRKQRKDVIKLFERMRIDGVNPSYQLYRSTIMACYYENEWERVLLYFDEMRSKYVPSRHDYSRSTQACVKLGDWQKAVQLLKDMTAQNKSPGRRIYGNVIRACNDGGQFEQALEIYKQMLEHNVKPNLIIYSHILLSYKYTDQLNKAKELMQAICSNIEKTKPSVISCCALISGLAEIGEIEDALKLVKYIDEEQLVKRNDIRQYSAVISAYDHIDGESAKRFLHKIDKRHGLDDVTLYNVIVQACAERKRLLMAADVYEEMRAKNIRADVSTYRIIMNVCEKSWTGEQNINFLSVLMDMHKDGFVPTNDILNCTLLALEENKKWKDITFVFEKMCLNKDQAAQNVTIYSAAAVAYSELGEWAKSYDLLGKLTQNDLCPTEAAYSATLESCEKAEQSIRAVELFESMQQHGFEGSKRCYTAAISAYERLGQLDQAERMCEIMAEKKLVPDVSTYPEAMRSWMRSCHLTVPDPNSGHTVNP